jgi:hypothetical protein
MRSNLIFLKRRSGLFEVPADDLIRLQRRNRGTEA